MQIPTYFEIRTYLWVVVKSQIILPHLIIPFKLMPGQGGNRNTAKGTFFGINQLVVVAVDPKDGDKDGDSPGNEDDGEEDPGELGSNSIQLN